MRQRRLGREGSLRVAKGVWLRWRAAKHHTINAKVLGQKTEGNPSPMRFALPGEGGRGQGRTVGWDVKVHGAQPNTIQPTLRFLVQTQKETPSSTESGESVAS